MYGARSSRFSPASLGRAASSRRARTRCHCKKSWRPRSSARNCVSLLSKLTSKRPPPDSACSASSLQPILSFGSSPHPRPLPRQQSRLQRTRPRLPCSDRSSAAVKMFSLVAWRTQERAGRACTYPRVHPSKIQCIQVRRWQPMGFQDQLKPALQDRAGTSARHA
jgi:hypothetical protein